MSEYNYKQMKREMALFLFEIKKMVFSCSLYPHIAVVSSQHNRDGPDSTVGRSAKPELALNTRREPPAGGCRFFIGEKIFLHWKRHFAKIWYTHNKHKTKKKNRLADVNLFAYRYLPENFSMCNNLHIDVTLKFYRYVIDYISIKNILHFFSKKRISIKIWLNTQKSIDYQWKGARSMPRLSQFDRKTVFEEMSLFVVFTLYKVVKIYKFCTVSSVKIKLFYAFYLT